jgi:FMN phosphatase YigB (HAD superfamily)
MIEDLPANLKPAKEMGMTTVLVDQDLSGIQERDGFVDYEIADILDLKKLLERIDPAI